MDDTLLDIMQMSDSMFPAGAFAMSHGIETMHQNGEIRTAADLRSLLISYMAHQTGPSDCAAAAQAHRHSESGDITQMLRLDYTYMASKPVAEAREASARSGSQMIKCISEILHHSMVAAYVGHIQDSLAPGSYPVVFGICCQAMDISEYGTAQAIAYGFAAGCVGAALRLGIIQHIEAQIIIHDIKPHMKQAAQDGCAADSIWQFCPQAEILQMAHEDQDSKMFIT